jgi:hypothetical protein
MIILVLIKVGHNELSLLRKNNRKKPNFITETK